MGRMIHNFSSRPDEDLKSKSSDSFHEEIHIEIEPVDDKYDDEEEQTSNNQDIILEQKNNAPTPDEQQNSAPPSTVAEDALATPNIQEKKSDMKTSLPDEWSL